MGKSYSFFELLAGYRVSGARRIARLMISGVRRGPWLELRGCADSFVQLRLAKHIRGFCSHGSSESLLYLVIWNQCATFEQLFGIEWGVGENPTRLAATFFVCCIQAFFDAVDGMRVAIGPGVVFRYVILGLFHPARKVS